MFAGAAEIGTLQLGVTSEQLRALEDLWTNTSARRQLAARWILETLASIFVDNMRLFYTGVGPVARTANSDRYGEFVNIAAKHVDDLQSEISRHLSDLEASFISNARSIERRIRWAFDRLRAGPISTVLERPVLTQLRLAADDLDKLCLNILGRDYSSACHDLTNIAEEQWHKLGGNSAVFSYDCIWRTRLSTQSIFLEHTQGRKSTRIFSIVDDVLQSFSIAYFAIDLWVFRFEGSKIFERDSVTTSQEAMVPSRPIMADRSVHMSTGDEAGVEFASQFEPDDVTIELLFEELFRRASGVVEITPSRFSPPKSGDQIARFREAVSKNPIQVSWPQETLYLINEVSELRQELIRYREKDSLFHGIDPQPMRDALASLTRRENHNREFLLHIPKRIPWIWLALIDYSGPFSSNSNLYGAIKNYLRFASLQLYHDCASVVHNAKRRLGVSGPAKAYQTEIYPRWEHGISMFFGDPFPSERNEDIVTAYVTKIKGVDVTSELVIYGPSSLTTRAYAESMARQPIISRWFMHYLVPQVELTYAISKPNELTFYSEEAWIRKVTALSGADLKPDKQVF